MAFEKENVLVRLTAAWQAGRLAHAYLFSGSAGCGKEWLVMQMAEMILETPQPAAHPDFHRVVPESKSRRIVIEQMRTMEQNLQMKPLCGSSKVAVVYDADRLQPQAANAFLKTLEEPSPGSHIFLLSTLPDAILETIVSRCVTVSLYAKPLQKREERRPLAKALAEALLTPGGPDLATAICFTRVFQKSIVALREQITEELETELKQEMKHYRESAHAKWEEAREGQIKAQTEAAVIREREILLRDIEEVLTAALRHHYVTSVEGVIADIARVNPQALLLKRLEALNRLRDFLARGVQEGLALESGFLKMLILHS